MDTSEQKYLIHFKGNHTDLEKKDVELDISKYPAKKIIKYCNTFNKIVCTTMYTQ